MCKVKLQGMVLNPHFPNNKGKQLKYSLLPLLVYATQSKQAREEKWTQL